MAQKLYYPQGIKQPLQQNRLPQDFLDWVERVNFELKTVREGTIFSSWMVSQNLLSLAADELVYASAANTAAKTSLTAYSRTLLDDATAGAWRTTLGLGVLATGDNGTDVPVSGFSGTLNGATTAQAALNILDTSRGLVLEAEAEANGSAEHLQVVATSTPSSILRMRSDMYGLVPEVDGDGLVVSIIMSDDSEIAVFDGQFLTVNNAVYSDGPASAFTLAALGTGTAEYFNARMELYSNNDSTPYKFWKLEWISENSAGSPHWLIANGFISSTLSAKGIRIDTNNAGDMINEGTQRLWVQT